jgi:hypothetical protein
VYTVLIFILAVLALVFAVSCVPVEIRFRLQIRDGLFARIRVGWLYGLIVKDVVPQRRASEFAEEPHPPTDQTGAGKRKLSSAPVLAALRQTGFPRRLLRLFRDTFWAMNLTDLRGKLRFGLEDPAETGFVLGTVVAPLASIGWYPSRWIEVEPDFTDQALEVHFEGQVSFVPLRMTGVFLGFFFSSSTISALKAAVSSTQS